MIKFNFDHTSIVTDYIFSPPVNPPKEIDDPEDKRPADWDDKEK